MSFPLYTLHVVRTKTAARSRQRDRDPERPRPKRRPPSGVKVPVYRIVLRKDRTIRAPRIRVDGPEAAAEVAHALIGDSPYEKILALLVNGVGDIVGAIIIGTTSSVSSTATSVRGVFSGAIAHNASAVILAHNHPSGVATPSAEDRAFALKAAAASDLLQIPVLDNLIVTRDPAVWKSFGAS